MKKTYEFGKTYHKIQDENIENRHLQLLVSGRVYAENWNSSNDKVNFYFVKEKVEHILGRLGIVKLKSEAISSDGFSEGLMYKFKKKRY